MANDKIQNHESLIRKEMDKLKEEDLSDHAPLISRSVVTKLVELLSKSEDMEISLSADNFNYTIQFVEFVEPLQDGNDGVFDDLPSLDEIDNISSFHVLVSENNEKKMTDVEFRNNVVECTPARMKKFLLRLQLAITNAIQ
ncbi:MAG: hypothetical protein LVQ96_01605 [Thermoplasmatales archaeon]|nr:hypothetical protein [Thermoplasmatales archaeon]MCW6169849.1 hypothetical protein [Thermoplasmatales archaeon]